MLSIKNISKNFAADDISTAALNNISFDVQAGELIAITGPSGCGKTTLLNILGLLDRPDFGRYELIGTEMTALEERDRSNFRRLNIGYIFQNFNLINDLNVSDNIDVGLIYRGISREERRRRIQVSLEQVGLAHRSKHYPSQLSGGQQQRVAIARALVSKPKLILADEPTGNLDSISGNSILDLLIDIAKQGTTVLMVTHAPEHAMKASRVIRMLDGKVIEPDSP